MYISNLVIHGFKSFAQKETLQFGDGITAVVGPNGCGKTNIVDAIRWVLGEQKYSLLRSGRMEDVIFGGSGARKPSNICEVRLTVHNDKQRLPVEYTDVEITRRIYRSGESEYELNRSACRLKDIQDLFVDTGMGPDAYSVIELKMIESILTENADDRRRLFEEAAGINRYRGQRREALNKFDGVHGDLNRVNDIIAEVEVRVGALRLQTKRYERHAELTAILREREIDLAYMRQRQFRETMAPIQATIASLKDLLEQGSVTSRDTDEDLERHQAGYKISQQSLAALISEIDLLEDQRQDYQNRLLVLTEQLRSNQDRKVRIAAERNELLGKKEGLAVQAAELRTENESYGPVVGKKGEETARHRKAAEALEEEATLAQRRVDTLVAQQLDQAQRVNLHQGALDRVTGSAQQRAAQIAEGQREISELERQGKVWGDTHGKVLAERMRLDGEEQKARDSLGSSDAEVRTQRETVLALASEHQRAVARVEGIESQLRFYREILESGEGYPRGARHILKNPSGFEEVLGALADLITVRQEHRPAVEAALRGLGNAIVCTDGESAKKLLTSVRKVKAGGITVIPAGSAARSAKLTELPSGDGIIGRASDLAQVPDILRPMIDLLLGDVAVVRDAAAAERVATSSGNVHHIVDLDGVFYHRHGPIAATEASDQTALLGRRDRIAALERELMEAQALEQSLHTQMTTASAKEADSDRHRAEVFERLNQFQKDRGEVEKQAAHSEFQLAGIREAAREITGRIDGLKREGASGESELDQVRLALENEKGKLDALQQSLQEARDRRDVSQQEREKAVRLAQDSRLELINLENERENLGFRLQALTEASGELDRRLADGEREEAGLSASSEELEGQSASLEEQSERLALSAEEKGKARGKAEQALAMEFEQLEAKQKEFLESHRTRESLVTSLKEAELSFADLERQAAVAEAAIREKYRANIPAERNVESGLEELIQEIERIGRSLEKIGPINWAVKEEYDQERERLEFLTNQRTDLQGAESSLTEAIEKIDTEARRLFLETFALIRTNFQNTFKLFFEGGEGDLELRGEEDVLERAIGVLARPPGKRTQNLRMLSAGEKALTAIALLFAIYQVKPSPFCILDEVDAPLDDLNIGKFTRVLRHFSEETQFIVITHNKLTMEAADYLYGITMEQIGVSKVVSVKLQ